MFLSDLAAVFKVRSKVHCPSSMSFTESIDDIAIFTHWCAYNSACLIIQPLTACFIDIPVSEMGFSLHCQMVLVCWHSVRKRSVMGFLNTNCKLHNNTNCTTIQTCQHIFLIFQLVRWDFIFIVRWCWFVSIFFLKKIRCFIQWKLSLQCKMHKSWNQTKPQS